MFNETFPLQIVLKLNALIHKIEKNSGLPCSAVGIDKNEFGVYFKQKDSEECNMYFGCWLPYWEAHHHPICIGVNTDNVSRAVRNAFSKSLKEIYKQDAISFDESWLMGWIPEADFKKPNVFEEIKPKLHTIWKSMSDAANEKTFDANKVR